MACACAPSEIIPFRFTELEAVALAVVVLIHAGDGITLVKVSRSTEETFHLHQLLLHLGSKIHFLVHFLSFSFYARAQGIESPCTFAG